MFVSNDSELSNLARNVKKKFGDRLRFSVVAVGPNYKLPNLMKNAKKNNICFCWPRLVLHNFLGSELFLAEATATPSVEFLSI